MLSMRTVSLYAGGKLLLNDANLTITPGCRIGIVGRNGTGKTHLLELLAGNKNPDSGKIVVAKDTTVLLVKQEFPDDDVTPLEYLRNNDPDIIEAEESLANAASDSIGDISDRLAQLDEERYEALAPKVLMGLGLTKEELNQPMRNLSGGMRMRIGLGLALVRTPDVLLLDEPTNHLDLEATQWLIAYLKQYPAKCAVIIVSHNLAVLKQVTNSTVHLRGGVLNEFSGDYEEYRRQLAIKEIHDERKNTILSKEADRHEEIYHKFRNLPASRAAQAVQQLRKAETKRGKIVEIIDEEPVVELNFGEHTPLSSPIVSLENVTIGYQKPLLSGVNLALDYGVKVGLLGRNGEGKSTLINLLVEKLEPKVGSVLRSQHLKIGYFSQNSADELNLDKTVFDEFIAKTGINKEQDIRSNLANYGFHHNKIGTKIDKLSGGEKSRLMFCFICICSPNFIILDEPTNHLDVETREVLANAIKTFKGTVILVSHDADLHQQTMNQYWLINRGKVTVYDKGINYYQGELQRLIDTLLPSSKTAGAPPEKALSNHEKKQPSKTVLNPHRFHQTSSTNSAKAPTTIAVNNSKDGTGTKSKSLTHKRGPK